MASKGTTGKRKAEWDAEVAKVKARLEEVWRDGEHTAESLWHQSAIAMLHWVSGHRSRVAGFRQAVKGTPVEKALDAALKAVRAEARAPAPRAPAKRTARPGTARKAATKRAARPGAARKPAKKRAAR